MLDVNVIKTTKKLIKKFRNEQIDILDNIPKLSEKLGEACSRIELSWSLLPLTEDDLSFSTISLTFNKASSFIYILRIP